MVPVPGKKASVALSLALLALLLPAPAAAKGPSVVATIFPLYEFCRAVMGPEGGELLLLLPPGAEPHTWEPRPSDIARVASCRLLVRMGNSADPWARDLLAAGGGTGGEELALSPGDKGDDPHTWLDLERAGEMVDAIAQALARLDGERSERYLANASAYRRRLQELDRRFSSGLSRCRNRTLVVGGHAAFGHLAERYQLRQLSLYGLSPDAEPSPRQMARVITTMRETGAEAVFFEDAVSDRLARVLAEETGARLLPLHAAGNITAGQQREGATYLSLMEENLANLERGLGCE